MCDREMSLEEWCGKLDASHRVNKELAALQSHFDQLMEGTKELLRLHFRALDNDVADMAVWNSAIIRLHDLVKRLEEEE